MTSDFVGGVKRMNAAIDRQTAFENMFTAPRTSLRNLSYSSLNSLVFELTVPAAHSEYVGFDRSHKLTKKVTDFVVKCVIIHTDNVVAHRLHPFKGYKKETSTATDFKNEVNLQQMLWTDAVQKKIPPLCPSIADAFILKTARDRNRLQTLMRSAIPSNNPRTLEMLTYLFAELADSRFGVEMGVILMPKVESSMTLHELYLTPNARIEEARISAIAQAIRMAVVLKTVHFDLHSNNILVHQTNRGTTSTIIDFGRAATFTDGHRFFSKSDDAAYATLMKTYAQNLHLAKTDAEKVAFVVDVISFLFYLESNYYKKSQMVRERRQWMLADFHTKTAAIDIFNTCLLNSTPRINRGTQTAHINRIIASGQLFSTL